MNSILKSRRSFALLLFVAGLLGVAGCFSSQFTLGPIEQAKVSRIFVGDWSFKGDGESDATISVRNFDDKTYFVEIKTKDGVEWYRAFTTDLKEVTFAHLQKLKDDGSLDDQWLLARVAITDGGKLVIRQLNDTFLKNKSIKSAEDLRKIVADNIDTDAMYDEPLTGTKTQK